MNVINNVSGFLSKTFDIISDPQNEDICGWGPHGDTIIIKKIDEFAKYILPKYFKHSNFQSFVRQLNMYDFHKTVQDPSNGEFQHSYFIRGRPELLCLIKRKAHSRSKSKQVQHVQHQHQFESDGTDGEMQRILKDDFERRLSELETQQCRIMELESQQEEISKENSSLKRMIQESRGKMERVLKMLYQAYMNSQARRGGQLQRINSIEDVHSIPESKLLEFCHYLEVEPPPQKLLQDQETIVRMNTPQKLQLTVPSPPPNPNVTVANSSSSDDLGKPLESYFSFDTLAHVISLPNESNSMMPVKDGTGSNLARIPSIEYVKPNWPLPQMTQIEGGNLQRLDTFACEDPTQLKGSNGLENFNSNKRPLNDIDVDKSFKTSRPDDGVPVKRLDTVDALSGLFDESS